MLKKTRTGRFSILSFVLLLIPSFCLHAEIIIHIQHPWASDSARLANPLYIQSNESGWYPGKKMIDEGGNWFTYTLKTMTQTTNDRGNLRIALSWIGNVDPTNYVSKLSDLDLELIGPDSSIIAKSASLVNPVEMIAITNAQKDQQYIIRIKTAKNVNYATPFSVAWVNR